MPLLAATRQQTLSLGGHGTLMARCLAAGLPVASSCSGRGLCGRCAVEVLEGAGALSPMEGLEALVLRRNGVPEGYRLSCCCRVLDTRAELRITTGYW